MTREKRQASQEIGEQVLHIVVVTADPMARDGSTDAVFDEFDDRPQPRYCRHDKDSSPKLQGSVDNNGVTTEPGETTNWKTDSYTTWLRMQ